MTAPLVTFPQGPVNGVADLSAGPLILKDNDTFDVIPNATLEWTIQFWATPDATTPQLQYVGLLDSQLVYVILERHPGDLWYMWPVVNDAGNWKIADLIQIQDWQAGDWRLFNFSFDRSSLVSPQGTVWYQVSENADPASATFTRNGYDIPMDVEGSLGITFPLAGPLGDISVGKKSKLAGRFTGLVDDLAVTSGGDPLLRGSLMKNAFVAGFSVFALFLIGCADEAEHPCKDFDLSMVGEPCDPEVARVCGVGPNDPCVPDEPSIQCTCGTLLTDEPTWYCFRRSCYVDAPDACLRNLTQPVLGGD